MKGPKMAAQRTKSQLIERIAAENEVAKKDVKGVLETLTDVGYKELKKTGIFLVPGFAKFVVIKKPATKVPALKSGEPMVFKAKPVRNIVRARPVKPPSQEHELFRVLEIQALADRVFGDAKKADIWLHRPN